jgi:hypothetical protein
MMIQLCVQAPPRQLEQPGHQGRVDHVLGRWQLQVETRRNSSTGLLLQQLTSFCHSEPTWPFNPQFRMWCTGQVDVVPAFARWFFSCHAQAEAVVSLSQTDSRSTPQRDELPIQTCIGMTIWRCKAGAAPQRVWSSGNVVGCVRASNFTAPFSF